MLLTVQTPVVTSYIAHPIHGHTYIMFTSHKRGRERGREGRQLTQSVGEREEEANTILGS